MKYSDFAVILVDSDESEFVLFRGDPKECINFLCNLVEPPEGCHFGLRYTEHLTCDKE